MQQKNIIISAISLVGFAWQPAFALTEINGCDPEIAKQVVRDSQNALEEAKKNNEALGDAMRNIPSPSNRSTAGVGNAFSCIDQLKNTSVSASIGIPTLDNVLKGLIDSASNAICNQANNVINESSRAVNKSISFPGIHGMPGTGSTGSIYVGGPSGITVNNQPINIPNMSPMSTPQQQPQQPRTIRNIF